MDTTTTTPPDDLADLKPENLPDPSPPPADAIGLKEIEFNNVDDIDTRRCTPSQHQDRDIPDESPMQMGDDGDDIGKLTKIKFRIDGNGDTERQLNLLAPVDMLQSGHGFMVRDLGERPRSDWAKSCELCGMQLLPPAGEWVCEVGNLPGSAEWDTCSCNWCLLRGQWLRGEYRPRGGRPAKRCGTAECTRKAATARQRKSRANRKARSVTETPLKVEG